MNELYSIYLGSVTCILFKSMKLWLNLFLWASIITLFTIAQWTLHQQCKGCWFKSQVKKCMVWIHFKYAFYNKCKKRATLKTSNLVMCVFYVFDRTAFISHYRALWIGSGALLEFLWKPNTTAFFSAVTLLFCLNVLFKGITWSFVLDLCIDRLLWCLRSDWLALLISSIPVIARHWSSFRCVWKKTSAAFNNCGYRRMWKHTVRN